MRIHVDLTSHLAGAPQIIQVEKSPDGIDPTEATPINGKYLIPVPQGLDFHVDTDSYVLNGGGIIDGGDVTSIAFAHLLAMFPQYGNIYFNPLLTDDHVSELESDPTNLIYVDRTVIPPNLFGPRFQSGRIPGVKSGNAPNMTAVLAANDAVTPTRPGLLITQPLDIGPYTLDCNSNEVGTDDFMLYWKLYEFSTSEDIASDYGAQAGTNQPAIKSVTELDPETADFSAWISTDGGATWCEVGLLEPIAFCNKTTEILVAFRNDSTTTKRYITHFAVLF